MKRSFVAVAVTLAISSFALDASAQVAPYAGVGVGPAIRIDDWPNQFRVEQEIGLTFGGRTGFFLAFAPSQGWGSNWWVLVFPARLGGVFDLFRNDDLRFQIGGSGTAGIAVSDIFDTPRQDPQAWFHLSVGLLLRFIIMDDKLAIYVRPVSFEFAITGDNPFYGNEAIRYVATGGVQYYF